MRILGKLTQKILLKIWLKYMDNLWYYTGKNEWELFPPSFYYTHTEEEIERITKDAIKRIQKLIDELE